MVFEEWSEKLHYRIQNYSEGKTCKINVYWKPGMKSDFADVKFSDSDGQPLLLWRQEYTAYTSAVFRITLKKSKNVFLHYGNGSAVYVSNFQSMFPLADEFNDTTVNTNIWSASGSVAEDGSQLTLGTGTASLTSTATFGMDYVLEWRWKISNTAARSSVSFYGGETVGILVDNDYFDSGAVYSRTLDGTGSDNYIGSAYTTTFHNWKIVRIGSDYTAKFYVDDVLKNTHDAWVPTSNCNVRIDLSEAGYNTYVDWILVRPYLATEPTAVYVGASSTSTNGWLGSLPVTLSRESGMYVSDIYSKASLSDVVLNRSSGMKVSVEGKINFDGHRLNQVHRSSGQFVGDVKELGKQTSIHLHNVKALMSSSKVNIKSSRTSDIHRYAGSYILDVLKEGSSRQINLFRFYFNHIGCYIPEIATNVSAQKQLHVSSGMSVEDINVRLERAYWGVRQRREAASYIEAQEIISSWGADWNRDAQLELVAVEMRVSPNPGREVLFFVDGINLKASRQLSRVDDALMTIPLVGLKARTGTELTRESGISVSPVLLSSNRSGEFHRNAGSLIPIIEIDFTGSGLIERVSTMYVGSTSELATRILRSSRFPALEVLKPCILVSGAVNADRPNAPFEIDFDRPDYLITVDKPEYGLELSKGLYYAVVRDGENLIEITQFDTDTFYAYLYDTDPVTDEQRAMPLSGKTVKAVLRGGAPDTTVTVDCTIVEDGKVRVDLTTANTAVVGKYFLKFVVLAEGYRKEIPERRDDFIEVQINDAHYVAPT